MSVEEQTKPSRSLRNLDTDNPEVNNQSPPKPPQNTTQNLSTTEENENTANNTVQNTNQNESNAPLVSLGGNRTENSSRASGPSVQLATKQYRDIIQFHEPSTSKNISVKAEIRINILSQRDSELTNGSNSQISLSLLKDQKENIEEDSFHTMDTCIKDKNVNTNVHYNERLRTLRSEAPPPYEPSQPPPAYSAVTRSSNPPRGYQQPVVVVERTERAYDARRGPTYNRNDPPDPFSSTSDVFSDRRVRHKFVQKVYAILAIQLLFSFGFVFLTMFCVPVRTFVRTDLPSFICFSVFWLILYIALMCYKACRRIFPLNFILLVLFTICQAYILGAMAAYYTTKVVLITLGATAGICFTVSIIACQNWFDITKWGFILAIAGIVIMVFGLVASLVTIFTGSNIVYLVFAGLATALFTVYLLYDTQCILGGRRVEVSPEEYIFGVLTLYVDICLIFMYMLHLVNACS